MENTSAIYDTVEADGALMAIFALIVPKIPSNKYQIFPEDECYVFLGEIQKCKKALLDTFKLLNLSTFHFPRTYSNHPEKLASIADLENLCMAIKNFNTIYPSFTNKVVDENFVEVIYKVLDVFDTLLNHEYIEFHGIEMGVTILDRLVKLVPSIVTANENSIDPKENYIWATFTIIFFVDFLLHRLFLSTFLVGEKKTNWSVFSFIYNFLESIKTAINWTFISFFDKATTLGMCWACIAYGFLVFVMKYGTDFVLLLNSFNRDNFRAMINYFNSFIAANTVDNILDVYKEYGKRAESIILLFFENFHQFWDRHKFILSETNRLLQMPIDESDTFQDIQFLDNFNNRNNMKIDDSLLYKMYNEYNNQVMQLRQKITNKYIGRFTYTGVVNFVRKLNERVRLSNLAIYQYNAINENYPNDLYEDASIIDDSVSKQCNNDIIAL